MPEDNYSKGMQTIERAIIEGMRKDNPTDHLRGERHGRHDLTRRMFKVYYSDRIAGNHAPSLPPGSIPLAFPTETAAFRVAFKALQSDRIVWKIECPDGTIVSRDEIEFIYRNAPLGFDRT
jgi:hypothetical protein